MLNIFQGKGLSIVEYIYYQCIFALNWNLSDIFITRFSVLLIPGMSKFYMWMTKCLVIISFMSKWNFSRLSIHNTILLSPLSSQFKIELGTLIENSNYIKLLKVFSCLLNQNSAFNKLRMVTVAGIKSMYWRLKFFFQNTNPAWRAVTRFHDSLLLSCLQPNSWGNFFINFWVSTFL